ncbi:MAG TPA: type II toxin-antitoxin system VapC family toxin [Chthonomonadaceae bacterium]|nr:type II toxin-antitoxin system VapC family toxin [Chthonomonadaceae bacterium]
MYLLDTDHISLLHRGGPEADRIHTRLAGVPPEQVALCIISYEEQMRGWLAEIARARSVAQQKPRYAELHRMLELYCATPLLPFEDEAIAVFQSLWLQRLRIGTMDLKIAAIALANAATLLTRNLSDFSKVPGLQVEDWTL